MSYVRKTHTEVSSDTCAVMEQSPSTSDSLMLVLCSVMMNDLRGASSGLAGIHRTSRGCTAAGVAAAGGACLGLWLAPDSTKESLRTATPLSLATIDGASVRSESFVGTTPGAAFCVLADCSLGEESEAVPASVTAAMIVAFLNDGGLVWNWNPIVDSNEQNRRCNQARNAYAEERRPAHDAASLSIARGDAGAIIVSAASVLDRGLVAIASQPVVQGERKSKGGKT